MDKKKKEAIQHIVDREIKNFVNKYKNRFTNEVDIRTELSIVRKIIVLLLSWGKNLCSTVHL